AGDDGPAWDVLQETTPDGSQLVVSAFQSDAGSDSVTVKPKALDAATTYEVQSVDTGVLGTATGADLMANGIDILKSPNTAAHVELRDGVGATIYLGAKASAEYAFTPLADGDCVPFGDVQLQALETPGHTPESISLLVFDRARGGVEPHAVLTGDTLFVGD